MESEPRTRPLPPGRGSRASGIGPSAEGAAGGREGAESGSEPHRTGRGGAAVCGPFKPGGGPRRPPRGLGGGGVTSRRASPFSEGTRVQGSLPLHWAWQDLVCDSYMFICQLSLCSYPKHFPSVCSGCP